jgi:hypothetical protein
METTVRWVSTSRENAATNDRRYARYSSRVVFSCRGLESGIPAMAIRSGEEKKRVSRG